MTKFRPSILLIVLVLFHLGAWSQQETINHLDKDGKKQGTWIKKYQNNKVRYQGQFKDDKPTGAFFYYNEKGGKTSEVTYIGTDGAAEAKFFHSNGAVMGEGMYMNQQKDGLWKFYDDQSILASEQTYKSGTLDGPYRVYFLNGQVAAEITYVEGLKTGPFKEYFSDGEVRMEGTYLDNNFDGEYKQYYGGKQIMIKGQYRAAVKDGLWIYYADDGRIKAQQVFEKGKLIKQKIEEGFQESDIPTEMEEEDTINERQMMEEWYMKGPGG